MSQETYRQQLVRLVAAMSCANEERAVARDLDRVSEPSRVKMFVDGNLDKRFDKLEKQLAFVAAGFDDFDRLIVNYIRSCSAAAYDTGAADGERMLAWLAVTQPLSLEQHDYVTCQRARHKIEEAARANRLKHTRFQELYSLADAHIEELATNANLRLYLNPLRTWTRFETAELLDDETTPPANVLFFAVRDEVSTAVLELEGQVLLNELSDFQPCTLDQWVALTNQASGRDELLETARDLAEMGLVAIG